MKEPKPVKCSKCKSDLFLIAKVEGDFWMYFDKEGKGWECVEYTCEVGDNLEIVFPKVPRYACDECGEFCNEKGEFIK